jgi:predicted ATPase
VSATIAEVLGVHEAAQETELQTLEHALRDRQLLLVLDNLEQVLSAATDLPELLTAAPRLKVLVSSRVPLHISAELRVSRRATRTARFGHSADAGTPHELRSGSLVRSARGGSAAGFSAHQ